MLIKYSILISFVLIFNIQFVYASEEFIHLFVMASQSHMQGWKGNALFYPVDSNNIDQEVKFYWVTPDYGSSGGKWVTLGPQDGLYPKGHFGPEITFARKLRAAGYNPAIFKVSRGGTSIGDDWQGPGEGGLYDLMISEYKHAISLLATKGREISISGFIWLQGESDAKKSLAKNYDPRLKEIISHIRNVVTNKPGLPVLLGVDEDNPAIRKHPEVLKALTILAEKDNIAFISMRGLEKADSTHLTPKGIEGHGVRLFE